LKSSSLRASVRDHRSRARGCAVSLLAPVALLLWLAYYVLTVDPVPVTESVGSAPAGSASVPVRDATVAGAFGPRFPGARAIVQTAAGLHTTRVIGWDADHHALRLEEPLPFDVSADQPATVASTDVATAVARFDDRIGLRRFPASDSRIIAYTSQGMSKPVMRRAGEWVKVEIRSPVEGWVPADRAISVDEGEVADRALMPANVPVRRTPYADEALVRWEGRIVTKRVQETTDGSRQHEINAEAPNGDHRTFTVPQTAWNAFAATDYIIDREGKGISKAEPPMAFTQPSPPYEVIAREGAWLRIELQDQGWVTDDSCTFDVVFRYKLSRRQTLRRWLFRAPVVGALAERLTNAYFRVPTGS